MVPLGRPVISMIENPYTNPESIACRIRAVICVSLESLAMPDYTLCRFLLDKVKAVLYKDVYIGYGFSSINEPGR
jgi:hypothetical protein